jgi:hypothetical protein
VIAVRNFLMTASVRMVVSGHVVIASVRTIARVGLGRGDGQRVLVNVTFMTVMEVTVVDVVDVALMLNLGVSALVAMEMRMIGMRCMCHESTLSTLGLNVNSIERPSQIP